MAATEPRYCAAYISAVASGHPRQGVRGVEQEQTHSSLLPTHVAPCIVRVPAPRVRSPWSAPVAYREQAWDSASTFLPTRDPPSSAMTTSEGTGGAPRLRKKCPLSLSAPSWAYPAEHTNRA